MGKGKGRRRRQANYLAAHGSHPKLPAPPTASDVAALPSKLRRIITLKSASPHGFFSASSSKSLSIGKSYSKGVIENPNGKKGMHGKRTKIEKQEDASNVRKQGDTLLKTGVGNDVCSSEASGPRRKKRKREVELQILSEKFKATPIRKGLNDRKKTYLQEKKNKKKRGMHFDSNEQTPLHKQEKISFGDIVEAPPKLSYPKKQKNAAEERLRQQAIATYREKNKWFSRPGSHQPPPLANERTLST